MDKYIEAERRLAELLDWKIKYVGDVATGWYDSAGNYQSMCPAWTRDNAAAFALMVEHGCYPIEVNGGSHIIAWRDLSQGGDLVILASDHPSKKAAVRYAIVQAVIAMLEARKK